MDYQGQRPIPAPGNTIDFRGPNSVPNFNAPVNPDHKIGSIGNIAGNALNTTEKNRETGIFSPEEIVSVNQEKNFEDFLPKTAENFEATSTIQGVEVIDFNQIRTGNSMSSGAMKQVATSIHKFKKNASPCNFVNEYQEMLKANLMNSYGRTIGDDMQNKKVA